MIIQARSKRKPGHWRAGQFFPHTGRDLDGTTLSADQKMLLLADDQLQFRENADQPWQTAAEIDAAQRASDDASDEDWLAQQEARAQERLEATDAIAPAVETPADAPAPVAAEAPAFTPAPAPAEAPAAKKPEPAAQTKAKGRK